MTLYKWSQTAASDATADSTINWAEGQAPSSVNDSARAMMAAIAKYRDDNNGSLTTGGTSTAYTLTSNQTFTTLALMNRNSICFVPHAISGAAPTLNVDGLGALPLRLRSGITPPTGAFSSGCFYTATFSNSSSEWITRDQVAVLPSNVVVTASITDDVVTYAKIQNVSTTSRLLGRVTAAAGDIEEIPLGTGLSFSAGSLVANSAVTSTITDANVTYAKIQNVAASRLLGNPTGGAAAPSEIAIGTGLAFSGTTLNGSGVVPTIQSFTSGSSQTYTTPAGVKWLEVRVVGGGSGGGGGNQTTLSTAGGASSFDALTASGGAGSSHNVAGAGGSASGGNVANMAGAPGGVGNTPSLNHNSTGGAGGCSSIGGAGAGANSNVTGTAAATNSGSGGGGGGSTNGTLDGSAGCGGAAGGTIHHLYTSPAATYTYTVGAGGAGASGTNINSSSGGNGGSGAAGYIVVIEHY